MSLSTYSLKYCRHLARLRRRRRAFAPTSNTASHDNQNWITSWKYMCLIALQENLNMNGTNRSRVKPSGILHKTYTAMSPNSSTIDILTRKKCMHAIVLADISK